MPVFFEKLEKVKPFYDATEKVVLVLCKLLLIADILITSWAILGRYVPFIKDPSWSEEVVLTCMIYMAVLSASIALRHNSHIRMTAFDGYMPKRVLQVLDLLADIAVLAFAIIMLVVGWNYAHGIGGKGNYVSMPWLSKFWLYFPIPLAGFAMIIFELENIFQHVKAFFLPVDAADDSSAVPGAGENKDKDEEETV